MYIDCAFPSSKTAVEQELLYDFQTVKLFNFFQISTLHCPLLSEWILDNLSACVEFLYTAMRSVCAKYQAHS